MHNHQIKNSLKDYFTFTKRERRGVSALLVILIILFGVLFYTHFITEPKSKMNIAAYEREIKKFEASLIPKKEKVFIYTNSIVPVDSSPHVMPHTLFPFNPNNLPVDQWKKLGVPDWIVKRIKNYESKGGRFKKKEDVQKIYSMPADLYQQLEPFIQIASADTVATPDKYSIIAKAKEEERKNLMVDINLADESELDALPLIGAGRAKAIIKYRDKLRGFTGKEQLLEIWGFNDTIYNAISDHVQVKAKFVQPININTNDPSQLNHPYISKALAKMIALYHSTHGDYTSVEQIKKLPLVNADLYAKLVPYLTVK